MKKILLTLALASAFLLGACGGTPPPNYIPSESEMETPVGGYGQSMFALSCAAPALTCTTRHYTVCGVDRTTLECVPNALSSSSPAALYVGLHGANGTSATMMQKNIWFCLGNQEVSIYPQGVHQGPPQNANGWDIMQGGCDDTFVMGAVADVEARFSVDTAKVRVYGFSMGSLESQTLVMAHPMTFNAMGIVSTNIPWTQSPPSPNTFTLSFFQDSGALDNTFPIAQQRACRDDWLAAVGGYSASGPGYDSQFTSYTMNTVGELGTYGECPTCGHGWYNDTSPAMASFFIALGL